MKSLGSLIIFIVKDKLTDLKITILYLDNILAIFSLNIIIVFI